MNQRRILVAYDGSEEAYWALMQGARAALETGAEIGIVTVLSEASIPSLVAASDDAAKVLREHELEPVLNTPIGDYDTIYVGRRPDSSLARGLRAGAAFVKTSSGFLGSGATLHDVTVLRQAAGTAVAIKATGGVRFFEDAVACLETRASRLGTSQTEAVLASGVG